jgi:hypothetical protein
VAYDGRAPTATTHRASPLACKDCRTVCKSYSVQERIREMSSVRSTEHARSANAGCWARWSMSR